MDEISWAHFRKTIAEGWEIDFSIDGIECKYDMWGHPDNTWGMRLDVGGELICQEDRRPKEGIFETVMSKIALDGKNLEELRDRITINDMIFTFDD